VRAREIAAAEGCELFGSGGEPEELGGAPEELGGAPGWLLMILVSVGAVMVVTVVLTLLVNLLR